MRSSAPFAFEQCTPIGSTMRLLLAVQRGDLAGFERAFEAEVRFSSGVLATKLPAAAASPPQQSSQSAVLAPGCRAVVVLLPNNSARHNGESCLVVRREGEFYAVRCDSGAALRLKPENLRITPGAHALTTRHALWFACAMLPPDSSNTMEAHQRRDIARLLINYAAQQTALSTTVPSNHVALDPVDAPIGPMKTTPLLECCCAGAFGVAKELVSAFRETANAQCSVPVGAAGPAAGATPLLVACSYQPAGTQMCNDGSSSDDDEERHEARQKRARVALEQAPLAGLASLVDSLLGARADVNAMDEFGRTPALACIVNGQLEALKILLASDPPPRLDARCKQSGLSPLAAVCVMGSSLEMSRLVESAACEQGLRYLAVEERRAANTSGAS